MPENELEETTLDALKRLTWRVDQLLDVLEKDEVKVGLWTALTVQHAQERARQAIQREEAGRKDALDLAVRYGGIDGDHHKAWVIDQMVRALTGPEYEAFVQNAKAGEDGPETYDWDEGIAP